MHLERLSPGERGDDVELRFHRRLTVVAGLGADARRRLATGILSA